MSQGEIVSIRLVIFRYLEVDMPLSFEQVPPPRGTAHRSRTAVTILRRRQVESEAGCPRSTLYLRISQGLWTRPVSLGGRTVGWPASEVEALNLARIAGKTEAQIRELVIELTAARKNLGAAPTVSAV